MENEDEIVTVEFEFVVKAKVKLPLSQVPRKGEHIILSAMPAFPERMAHIEEFRSYDKVTKTFTYRVKTIKFNGLEVE